ncbi:hypothetical protein Tco_0540467 [Tanacetum coccineum]
MIVGVSHNLKGDSGIMYHDFYLGRKALVEKENVGLDLTKSDLCPSFVEDLTAKGMGLYVADLHTGVDPFRAQRGGLQVEGEGTSSAETIEKKTIIPEGLVRYLVQPDLLDLCSSFLDDQLATHAEITDSAIALDYGINAHYMGQAYQEAVIAIGVL